MTCVPTQASGRPRSAAHRRPQLRGRCTSHVARHTIEPPRRPRFLDPTLDRQRPPPPVSRLRLARPRAAGSCRTSRATARSCMDGAVRGHDRTRSGRTSRHRSARLPSSHRASHVPRPRSPRARLRRGARGWELSPDSSTRSRACHGGSERGRAVRRRRLREPGGGRSSLRLGLRPRRSHPIESPWYR